jgi:hypothetical protein
MLSPKLEPASIASLGSPMWTVNCSPGAHVARTRAKAAPAQGVPVCVDPEPTALARMNAARAGAVMVRV